MSGGHFNYEQYRIEHISDEVEQLILNNSNEDVDEYGDRKGTFYSDATIREFEQGLEFLRRAQIYAQRIDWLVSGDDSEDTFHTRLASDLSKIK